MITAQAYNGLFAVIASELTAVEDRLQEPVEKSGALLQVVASYPSHRGGSGSGQPWCCWRLAPAVPTSGSVG
jgi:hypothetical protein